MPLFEVAILEMPTQKEVEEGTAEETLVFGPVAVVAKDKESASIKSVMDGKCQVKQSRMKVLVRPFA